MQDVEIEFDGEAVGFLLESFPKSVSGKVEYEPYRCEQHRIFAEKMRSGEVECSVSFGKNIVRWMVSNAGVGVLAFRRL